MELMWVKEAADAQWEARRLTRKKSEWLERNLNRGKANFNIYQALDIAYTRATKRRDKALRQIERWRAGLGAKPRRLPDEFIAEQALAEHYGVDQSIADEAEESALTLANDREALGPAAPLLAHTEEAAETAAPHAFAAGEVAQDALESTCSIVDASKLANAVHMAPEAVPAGQTTETVLPPAEHSKMNAVMGGRHARIEK
jgi:hypothetical protein